jgi:collagenase-like PrtC family protease
MKLFSVPADFRTSTVDRLAELNARHEDAAVAETFGSITRGGLFGSGRPNPLLPKIDFKQLEKYVGYAASKGIDFNYTLNASCAGNLEVTGSGLHRAERFFARLWDIGIRHLTVSMPTLMSIIKESGHPFSVKASTICQINSAYKAQHYRNRGLDRMVIDEDITRDFRRIQQICAAFGDGVEMIVNSACIKDCPNKMFHYNAGSHSTGAWDAMTFYRYYCTGAASIVDPRGIMRLNWVRPEDLGLYESAGISRFKLQGRQIAVHGDVVRAVETYMDGSYSGNLYDLLWLFDPKWRKNLPYYPYIDNKALEGFLKPFFDDPEHCTGDCDACGYCASFAAASMDTEANRELIPTAKERINKRDDPVAVYHGAHPAKRLFRRLVPQGYEVARSLKHYLLARRG